MEQFQVKGRTLVIRMPKELDHHTTGQIPGIADRMIGEKNIQRIEFDFRDTGFMDSSGIGVIMGRYQKLRLTWRQCSSDPRQRSNLENFASCRSDKGD